jgi:hypothetical protein
MPKFEKGQSGNPGGRPKVVGEVRDLAQAYTREAIETLAAIMRDTEAPAAARAAASNAILDRGFGRPAQTVHATTSRTSAEEKTDAELMAIVAGGAAGEPDGGQDDTQH